jgi:hypothetical protein
MQLPASRSPDINRGRGRRREFHSIRLLWLRPCSAASLGCASPGAALATPTATTRAASQGLLLGAGVGSDRAWRGVEQVGVVGHAGVLAHVLAEQVQIPGAFEVISRWFVAGPMDLDDSRRCWRAHGASYRRRGGGLENCPAEAREHPKRPIGPYPQRPSGATSSPNWPGGFRRHRRGREVGAADSNVGSVILEITPQLWGRRSSEATNLQLAMRLTNVELWL